MIKKGYTRNDIPRLYDVMKSCYSGIELPDETTFNSILMISEVWVYRDRGLIVGFCVVQPENIRGPYLWSVAVMPWYRRKGIATDLIKAASEYLSQRDYSFLTLHVRPDNPAHKLYSELGFLERDIIKNYYKGDDAYEMELYLKEAKWQR